MAKYAFSLRAFLSVTVSATCLHVGLRPDLDTHWPSAAESRSPLSLVRVRLGRAIYSPEGLCVGASCVHRCPLYSGPHGTRRHTADRSAPASSVGPAHTPPSTGARQLRQLVVGAMEPHSRSRQQLLCLRWCERLEVDGRNGFRV